MSQTIKHSTNWIGVQGRWDVQSDGTIICHGIQPGHSGIPYNYALTNDRIRQGQISTTVRFPDDPCEARILFGYSSDTRAHFSAGLGGYGFGYSIQEFRPGLGYIGLAIGGSSDHLKKGNQYQLKVSISGNRISLEIDSIEVLSHIIYHPLPGEQVGVCTVADDKDAAFSNFVCEGELGDLFVVMQFGEPYDSLYNDVIMKVADDEKLHAFRADDVYGPGIILEDIVHSLIEAQVIIVEITPPNPNVFYELGYAHALHKPTILLAEKGRSLPFDVSGYRVIFYQNTIGGKSKVETALRKHLRAIRAKP